MAFNQGDLYGYDPILDTRRGYDESEPSDYFGRQPQGFDPMQKEKPPVRPLSSISDPASQAGAESSIGESPNQPMNQPGNRRSIKEYLEEIRTLREQQAAMGMPEDQRAVPTFTNIEGGSLDYEQGAVQRPSGGQPVRSYMTPEYRQGERGIEYGSAHSITQGAEVAGLDPNMDMVSNAVDPDLPNSKTVQMFPEIRDTLRNQLGREPNPQEFATAANAVRMNFMEEQAKVIDHYQKIFKDAGAADMWEALQTGDWSKAMKTPDKINTPEARQKRQAKHATDWAKLQQKASMEMKPYPENPETGEPYQTGQEYVDQQMRQFDALMEFAKQKAAAQSGETTGQQVGSEQQRYFLFLRQQGVSKEDAEAETRKRYQQAEGENITDDAKEFGD